MLHYCEGRTALGRVKKGLELERTFQLALALAFALQFEF
jgi:hypothetical protein